MGHCDIFWKGKVIKIPENGIMTQDWTVYMLQDSDGVLLDLQAESKLLLVVCTNRYQKVKVHLPDQ